MKILLIAVQLIVSASLFSQTIREELSDLGVFKEKVVYEWLKEDELSENLPYVVIDRQTKPKSYKDVDPSEVKRIDKLDAKLGEHLFGDKAKNGVYRIIIDDETNKDSYFKLVSSSAYHSSCKLLEGAAEKKKCTEDYLDQHLNDLVSDQEEFAMQMSIDYNGNITSLEIVKGESNKELEELFEIWKKSELEWYPGVQRGFFVNQYLYYKKSKK